MKERKKESEIDGGNTYVERGKQRQRETGTDIETDKLTNE